MKKYLKVAKMPDFEEHSPSHYLYFNYWEKGKKHHIVITDYKGRRLGFIDLDKNDKVDIEDNQGNMQKEIDFALDIFFKNYLDKFKAKYGIVKEEEKVQKGLESQNDTLSFYQSLLDIMKQ